MESVFGMYGITASFFIEDLIILLTNFFFKNGLAASCIKTFLKFFVFNFLRARNTESFLYFPPSIIVIFLFL